jgi:hypothetical protein
MLTRQEGRSTGPPDRERRPWAEGADRDDAGGNVKASLPPAAPIDPAELARQVRRRREASWRLPPLDCRCGQRHRDPLDCRAAS